LTSGARSYRLAAAGCVAAIYASAYPVQFVLDFLRAHNLLRLSIASIALVVSSLAVAALARRHAGQREWIVLALVALVYLVAASRLDIVQERIHLVEYGVLALLLRRGLEPPGGGGEARALVTAFGLTALAGLGDELWQGVLPNRHFDWRDVRLNAISGALALAAAIALAAARSAAPGRPEGA